MTIHSPDGNQIVRLTPLYPDDDAFGHRRGVEARITSTVSCNPDQLSFISSFLNGILVKYGDTANPPLYSHGAICVDLDRQIKSGVQFWFDWFPTDIKRLVDDASSGMWSGFLRVLRLLRWEQNSSYRLPVRSALCTPYWRTSSDSSFYAVPERSSVRHARQDRERGWFGWEEPDRIGFHDLWSNDNLDEPLGHELHNEAELLVERAPRSALLMATAAVEAGVKDHIGRVAPITSWLMTKIPSPPIPKILKEYIPEIHRGNNRINKWSALTPLLNKVEKHVIPARNRLTHSGRVSLADEIHDYIKKTRDILYMLDYLEGHDWALNNLSRETRNLIGIGEPPEHRMQIEISMISGPDVGNPSSRIPRG